MSWPWSPEVTPQLWNPVPAPHRPAQARRAPASAPRGSGPSGPSAVYPGPPLSPRGDSRSAWARGRRAGWEAAAPRPASGLGAPGSACRGRCGSHSQRLPGATRGVGVPRLGARGGGGAGPGGVPAPAAAELGSRAEREHSSHGPGRLRR